MGQARKLQNLNCADAHPEIRQVFPKKDTLKDRAVDPETLLKQVLEHYLFKAASEKDSESRKALVGAKVIMDLIIESEPTRSAFVEYLLSMKPEETDLKEFITWVALNIPTNESLVRHLLETNLADKKTTDAMLKVPRSLFTLRDHKFFAYFNRPWPLYGEQVMLSPSLVASSTSALDVKKGMKVLEIGTGSGWQTAILAELTGENGRVYGLEALESLASLARKNIAKTNYRNIEIVNVNGRAGFAEAAPFDRILVTAPIEEIDNLVEQLAEGGKLVVVISSGMGQKMELFGKRNGRINKITCPEAHL